MNRAEEKTVVIGTVGAGYAASLHGNGYKKVSRSQCTSEDSL